MGRTSEEWGCDGRGLGCCWWGLGMLLAGLLKTVLHAAWPGSNAALTITHQLPGG